MILKMQALEERVKVILQFHITNPSIWYRVKTKGDNLSVTLFTLISPHSSMHEHSFYLPF
jgi:hypothetical protein